MSSTSHMPVACMVIKIVNCISEVSPLWVLDSSWHGLVRVDSCLLSVSLSSSQTCDAVVVHFICFSLHLVQTLPQVKTSRLRFALNLSIQYLGWLQHSNRLQSPSVFLMLILGWCVVFCSPWGFPCEFKFKDTKVVDHYSCRLLYLFCFIAVFRCGISCCHANPRAFMVTTFSVPPKFM